MFGARPLVVVAVALFIGGVATFAAGRVVAGARSYEYAVTTAVFGAAAWGVVAFLVGEGPPSRQLVPLLLWIAVVKWRYRESWREAASIGFVAWASVLVGLVLLSS